jgi:hypothetical protein
MQATRANYTIYPNERRFKLGGLPNHFAPPGTERLVEPGEARIASLFYGNHSSARQAKMFVKILCTGSFLIHKQGFIAENRSK